MVLVSGDSGDSGGGSSHRRCQDSAAGESGKGRCGSPSDADARVDDVGAAVWGARRRMAAADAVRSPTGFPDIQGDAGSAPRPRRAARVLRYFTRHLRAEVSADPSRHSLRRRFRQDLASLKRAAWPAVIGCFALGTLVALAFVVPLTLS
ncbi:hypothetical protein RKE29_03815 [Streptomyces sp. B1866]|uniref:hypothetical protein n=1 Tax=Streptomyces sp. B1866 TaxID=3075431 RepID=UPI002890F8B1|nr:hypothetical protein [Streptomyces sp. B1866]MDT3395782.1 hypothetical protein [Streptomyces sp. B1866]